MFEPIDILDDGEFGCELLLLLFVESEEDEERDKTLISSLPLRITSGFAFWTIISETLMSERWKYWHSFVFDIVSFARRTV